MDIALTGNNKDTVREDMKNTWGVTVRKAVFTVLAVEAVEAVVAVVAVARDNVELNLSLELSVVLMPLKELGRGKHR